MSHTATLTGVGRQEKRAPVDYSDALGHITMGTGGLRARQKPDSVYREHYTEGGDPVLANAMVEEIYYGPPPPRRTAVVLGDSSVACGARVYPDFGNDREGYELPKTRPFEHVAYRSPASGFTYFALMVPAVLGMLLLLFWALDQL
jgi:hypothetical protein